MFVLDVGVISKRLGLAEFVARIPGEARNHFILFGANSAEAQEVAARNGVRLIASAGLEELAFEILRREGVTAVDYLGDAASAVQLGRILSGSVAVIHLDPATGLEEILQRMGIAPPILDTISASGLEERLEQLRAA